MINQYLHNIDFNVNLLIKKINKIAKTSLLLLLCTLTLHSYSQSKKVFYVSDFGAKGDGISDDGPAVRKAVEAAVLAGSDSKVNFEKKTYRLDKTGNACQITLKGVTGLSIEGNGAVIINHPNNGIIDIDNCKEVTVGGFTFDCHPLPFTQGTITEVDPDKGTFNFEIHKGYDNPVKVYRDMNKKPDWGWGVCMDPVERKRKPEASMHFYIKELTELDADKNLMRVELTEDYRKYISEISTGDRFVITLKYGKNASNFGVNNSSDITLENNTIYTAKYSMTHRFTNNYGRVYAKKVNITFKPGTDRLITTPKDGFHCKHNAIGPVIEDGLFEGMLDDAINISVCPYWVKEDLGNNRYLVADVSDSPYPGDSLMAYTPESGLVTEHLKIISVEAKKAPQGQQGAWNIITLDNPIPELQLHQGNNLFPGGHDKLKFTGLYNINRSGKDYIIRNNTFREQRRYGVLARSSGGLIEGNSFIGVGGNGIYLANEIGSFYEGPFPANTIIRNNTFINTFWSAIKVNTNGKNVWAHDINISDNFFSGWYTSPREKGPAAAIHLINVDGSIIKGNTIESGKADPKLSSPILIQHSKNVELFENNIKAQTRKPNVLVIIVDDLGYGDLSCQGSTEIITPNIDRLANSGVRFTDGYVTAPQCGPSRAGLISGVFQDRFAYNDIINQRGLPPKSVLLTLPEQMKSQGYVTGMAGKWHIGYKNPEHVHPPEENNAPWLRGFDFVNMHHGGMTHYYNYSESGSEWNLWRGIDNRYFRKRESEREPSPIEDLDAETYMTDYLTDEACAFIQRHQSEPWFFYLSYNAPHTPMVAKKEKLANYEHLTGVRRVLAAMMESVDDGVGEVVEAIRASGQAENTMVWFLSDNGGETPQNGSLNGPLAGRKGHLFEGGIRVPFIVAFPGTIPGGKVENEPISSLDILPTSMALAGAKSIPEIYDGHNVMPWLQGKEDCPNDELFWSFWGNYALRSGDYKEVRSKRNDATTADGRPVPGHFFSDIRKNPGEDPDQPLNSLEHRQMLTAQLDQRISHLKADQQIMEPVYSPSFQQRVDERKEANQRALLLKEQQLRIDFEQIDTGSFTARDIIMPPMTNGYYTENCEIVEGVSGKGLRLKNSSMTIGKTPGNSEFKSSSPVTMHLWLKLEANTDDLMNVIDMTDNILPIEDSTPGYRLQINDENKLQLALKSSDGQVYNHVYESIGALPLNQWFFVALRYSDDNKLTLTCLDFDAINHGVASVAEAGETFQLSEKLSFSPSVLPRIGSNAKGNGNFFEGSIDEIGLARTFVKDEELLEACKKMLIH